MKNDTSTIKINYKRLGDVASCTIKIDGDIDIKLFNAILEFLKNDKVEVVK